MAVAAPGEFPPFSGAGYGGDEDGAAEEKHSVAAVQAQLEKQSRGFKEQLDHLATMQER